MDLLDPRTPDPVPVEVLEGWIEGEDAFVRLALSEPVWTRVERDGLFHLDGEHWPAPLPTADVLGYRVLVRGPRVLGGTADHALRATPRTDAWYAVEVERDLVVDDGDGARLSEGRTTGWAQHSAAPAPLLQACRHWFAARQVTTWTRPDSTVLQVGGTGPSGDFQVWVETDEERRTLGVLSVWEDRVAPERSAAVRDLAARWNLGRLTATVQVDPEAGIVSVRTGLELGDAPWHDDLLGGLVGAGASLMADLLPELRATAGG